MRFFLLLFLILGAVCWLGYSCVHRKTGLPKSRSVPVAVASPPVSPPPSPAAPASAPSGLCQNWCRSSSGLVWGWDASGGYHEGTPRYWVDGCPVF